MQLIQARSYTRDNTAFLVAHAPARPEHTRTGADHAGSGLNYRICGRIPAGRRPIGYRYFIRASDAEEHPSEWVACGGNGCEGYQIEFCPQTHQVWGHFKLWKRDGRHRDLMLQVDLA